MIPVHCRIPLALLLASVSAGTCGGAGAQEPPVATDAVREDLGNAIAGSLVVALSEQFGGRHVDMYIKALDTRPLKDGASMLTGTGVVSIEGRPGTVGFTFRLPWNPWLKQGGYPEVSVGGAIAGERHVPNDVVLVRQLEADVTSALAHHMRQANVSVRLDRIATVEGGNQFLRINAAGVAYFNRGGAGTALTILALYDRTRRAWMRLEYGLGEEAAMLVSR
jgi:hypothetical protein